MQGKACNENSNTSCFQLLKNWRSPKKWLISYKWWEHIGLCMGEQGEKCWGQDRKREMLQVQDSAIIWPDEVDLLSRLAGSSSNPWSGIHTSKSTITSDTSVKNNMKTNYGFNFPSWSLKWEAFGLNEEDEREKLELIWRCEYIRKKNGSYSFVFVLRHYQARFFGGTSLMIVTQCFYRIECTRQSGLPHT